MYIEMTFQLIYRCSGLRLSSKHKTIAIFRRLLHHTGQLNNSGIVTLPHIRAEEFKFRTAIYDRHGQHSFDSLIQRSLGFSEEILRVCNPSGKDLKEGKIALLCPNDSSYVIGQWSTWIAGGVSVPLCKTHPASEHEYFLKDSEATAVVVTEDYEENLKPICSKLDIPILVMKTSHFLCDNEQDKRLRNTYVPNPAALSRSLKNKGALMIYTSGTTGRPKGVLHTHGSLHAQVQSMQESWAWSERDVLLHTLPLHHVHGVINCLMTPLATGAMCVMLPNFNPKEVWVKLLHPIECDNDSSFRINMLMAVPSIYAKLIEWYEQNWGKSSGSQSTLEFVRSVCLNRIRLMVSGSAALPQSILEKWRDITGHTLLERYGMTETGMVLTQPLEGKRVECSVGMPFPGVKVRIAQQNVYDKNGFDTLVHADHRFAEVTRGCENMPGELHVKGPQLFREYYNKPDATKSEFTKDGWFKTGDTAIYQDNVFKIMGRTSVDIIKSGGYKISALDIERHLLEHEDIKDVAVVGLPDITWGQRVAAVLVMEKDKSIELPDLKRWASSKMPPYHIPTVIKCIPELPRNAMGKVVKKDLSKDIFPEYMKPFS